MIRGAKLSFLAATVTALLGTAGPARAQFEPPADVATPPPFVPVLVHHRRPGLIAAGAAVFGATYTASLAAAFLVAASSIDCDGHTCPNHASAYLLPVGGPLLAWARTPADQRGSPLLWAAWSGVQAAGVAMLTAGVLGHDVVEWRPFDAGPRVSVVPVLGPRSGALSLSATW